MTSSQTASRLFRLSDDAPSSEEAPSVRAQSAVVRSLEDAIEHLSAAGGSTDGLREQLLEEISRLEAARLVNV
jgi:hypothetical protein